MYYYCMYCIVQPIYRSYSAISLYYYCMYCIYSSPYNRLYSAISLYYYCMYCISIYRSYSAISLYYYCMYCIQFNLYIDRIQLLACITIICIVYRSTYIYRIRIMKSGRWLNNIFVTRERN